MSKTGNKHSGGNEKAHPSQYFEDSKPFKKHLRTTERPTRAVVIEKETFVNNLGPYKLKKRSNNTPGKLTTREVILQKYYEDAGVNTKISAIFKSDNQCNTMVQQRKGTGCNKCDRSHSQSHLNEPRRLFTLDKACSILVQTASCGTVIDDVKKRNSIRFSVPRGNETQTRRSPQKDVGMQVKLDSDENDLFLKQDFLQMPSDFICINKILEYNSKPAKRWAVSRDPIIGPDF